MGAHVVIVEDERGIRMALADNLVADGHRVTAAGDLAAGLRAACQTGVDLVVLDRMLPDGDGLELLRALRRRALEVPVLLLTARGQEAERVEGLRQGADDYVVKPFSMTELRARVAAILRRTAADPAETLSWGRFLLDPAARTLHAGDGARPVELTRREFDLLLYLLRHPQRAFRREELLDAVWGLDYEGSDRVVDRFVATLRKKLEADPRRPRHLLTVPGVGYRFEP